MINTNHILIEITLSSQENHKESLNSQLKAKKKRFLKQKKQARKEKDKTKTLIAMLVLKKMSRFHQKSLQKLIDSNTLCLQLKMIAKLHHSGHSKWQLNIKSEETKHSRVSIHQTVFHLTIMFILEMFKMNKTKQH